MGGLIAKLLKLTLTELVRYRTNLPVTEAIDTRGTRESLGFLLAKASGRWNQLLYPGFCRKGYEDIRPSYGSVLVPLFEEEGLMMSELARRARLSKQTMTTLVRVTEEKGLVVRERHPTDGRAFRIYLTNRTRAFREVAEKVLTELDEAVLTVLTPCQVADLKVSLKKLMDLETDKGGKK